MGHPDNVRTSHTSHSFSQRLCSLLSLARNNEHMTKRKGPCDASPSNSPLELSQDEEKACMEGGYHFDESSRVSSLQSERTTSPEFVADVPTCTYAPQTSRLRGDYATFGQAQESLLTITSGLKKVFKDLQAHGLSSAQYIFSCQRREARIMCSFMLAEAKAHAALGDQRSLFRFDRHFLFNLDVEVKQADGSWGQPVSTYLTHASQMAFFSMQYTNPLHALWWMYSRGSHTGHAALT